MAHERHVDGVIAERARKTLGLVTVRQLTDLGVSERHRRTLVSHGVLARLPGGVLRHAAFPPCWRQQVLAGVLAAGPGAVASHMSAAALWHFDGVKPGAVEVTVPRGRQPRALRGRAHRSRDLGAVDIEARGPIPVTTPARTLLDIAPRLDAGGLEQALDGAARDGLVWVPHLRWRLDELRRSGRPGVRRLAGLLDRTDGRATAESWLEQEALRLLRRSGVPMPRCQVRLRPAGGGPVRVDLLWDDQKLIVELDGQASHATRRRRQSDHERATRLRLEGWRVVTFTYEDVTERPDYVTGIIARLLAESAP